MAFPTCVSCGRNNRRAKLIKCLHSLCVCCLTKHLTSLNEIVCPSCGKLTPSPSAGKHQLLALPDSYVSANGYSGRLEATKPVDQEMEVSLHCDECFEDEKAVSTCMDCKAVLCELHAQSHARSRSTHNHKVQPIVHEVNRAGQLHPGTEEQARMYCIIHQTQVLQLFCTTCQEFLCEQCLRGKSDCKNGNGSPHSVLPVEKAAQKMKAGVQKLLDDSTSTDQESVLLRATENLKAANEQLHDRTEAVSEEVVKYFGDIVKLIKLREAELLEKLDLLCSAKLIPLEKQKVCIEETLSSQKSVSILLESCHDDYDLIRMAGWLEEAATAADEFIQNGTRPCVESHLVFQQPHKDQMVAAIACSGTVLDAADIDPNQSIMQCQPSVCINEEICITVKASLENGSPACYVSNASVTLLTVEVMSPDHEALPCETSKSGEGDDIVAKFQPTKPGKHQVMARYGGRHFSGSPTEIMVYTCRFDPFRCHGDIRLSSNHMTARVMNDGWRSVCGADIYRSGTVDINVRLDNTPNSDVIICMCRSSSPQLDDYQHDDTAFGWYGHDHSADYWRGTRLGQPWKTGDIIHLSLDYDRHTLMGRHGRTGATQTLNGVTGELYLCISMRLTGHQLTIF